MSKLTALVCACADASVSPIAKHSLHATLIDRPVYEWVMRACRLAGADTVIFTEDPVSEQEKSTTDITVFVAADCPLISPDSIRRAIVAAAEQGGAEVPGVLKALRTGTALNTPCFSLVPEDPIELSRVTTPRDLEHVSKLAQTAINKRLMASGVFMRDSSLVWVGPDVTVAPVTELLPMTMLFGKTEITGPSIIGPNTRLTDCTVSKDCVIDETVGISAVIESGVTTGPRAYLRPGTHLLSGAHVGTHVEIKNSTVGIGSKVPHLSYIGDTRIGAHVNIGAASITCNYDGKKKHPTVIGDNAFIGSDTIMVAPVSIGAGAVTGAASCITKDVPADALGIERSPQVNRENYRSHWESS